MLGIRFLPYKLLIIALRQHCITGHDAALSVRLSDNVTFSGKLPCEVLNAKQRFDAIQAADQCYAAALHDRA